MASAEHNPLQTKGISHNSCNTLHSNPDIQEYGCFPHVLQLLCQKLSGAGTCCTYCPMHTAVTCASGFVPFVKLLSGVGHGLLPANAAVMQHSKLVHV